MLTQEQKDAILMNPEYRAARQLHSYASVTRLVGVADKVCNQLGLADARRYEALSFAIEEFAKTLIEVAQQSRDEAIADLEVQK